MKRQGGRDLRLAAVLSVLAVIASGGAAAAGDFNFRIPLELVTTPFCLARISCGV